MEPVDIVAASFRNLTFLVTNHPVLSTFASVFLFFLLVKFYSKLTMGTCESKERMDGKTVFITGGTAGIGKETAIDLARRGAHVIIGCRDLNKGQRVKTEIVALTNNKDVHLQQLDLASFASVRKCAKEVLVKENNLHVLINNAGVAGSRDYSREMTEDGCEKIIQTNHLSHFLLTLLLLDLLKKSNPSRIVVVSSRGHHMGKLNLDDLHSEKHYDNIDTYCNSKLANILFTKELASRLEGTGVTVNALHPGIVKTDIVNGMKGFFVFFTQILFFWIGKSAMEGAQTSIYLAVDPALEKKTGKYFTDCKEELPSETAQDDTQAKQLWRMSEKIVGLSMN